MSQLTMSPFVGVLTVENYRKRHSTYIATSRQVLGLFTGSSLAILHVNSMLLTRYQVGSVILFLAVQWMLVIGQASIDSVPKHCPPCDCNGKAVCAEAEEIDQCSCCRRCNKGVGETCGESEGECLENLLCLPNDPYSASYRGQCYGER